MRVNSAFTRYLTTRLVGGIGIVILLTAIFTVSSSFKDRSDPILVSKEVNIIIRQIGHRLLLQAGDSSSRVMPVTEIKEGRFLLTFENKLDFDHDSLQRLSQSLLPKIKFPSGYTVTVQDCRKGEIVYGFQVNNSTPDILPCSGRNQPRGCYTIEFVFPDLYEGTNQENASANPRKNESKSKLTALDYNPDRKSKVDSQAVNPTVEGSKTEPFSFSYSKVMYAGLLVLLAGAFLVWRSRKNINQVPVQGHSNSIINASDPELPSLGKFLFNVKDQHLLFGDEMVTLTDKECKVLELLHKHFGELIPRETLLQEVWINEGVITGRSLDMFVSKLRKKLSLDPELRITNVHGKGYKLEMYV